MSKIAAIIGRLLIAIIFIVSGIGKLMDVAGTEQMIASTGLPGGFAIVVGLFELIAGISLAAGFLVRLVSVLLFLFVGATILFFHNQFNDPVQGTIALKNLAIMGGLLLAFAHSQMWMHYYAMTRERRGEVAARGAEQRALDAEVRAARAEGLAEGLTEGRAAVGGTADVDHDGVPEHRPHSRLRRWFDW